MIDLSKYEGHTPAPWTNWYNQYVVVDNEMEICEITYYVDKRHEANAVLIADAPLLLAEVERLQKMVNILTCCANCDHVYDSGIGHYCCKDHNKNSPLKENAQADNCCPHWKKEIAE